MSEPEYVTKADLASAMQEWREAMAELREATTPKEKEEARADVSDAREDLDALAQRMGISRGALERSMAEAKKAERREELGPIVQEMIEAYMDSLPDDEDSGASKAGDDGEEKTPAAAHAKGQKPEQEPPKEPKKDDSAPEHEHWSERTLTPSGLK